jgi:hypothetical protein
VVVARRPEGEAEQELVVVVVLAAAVLGAGKGSVLVLLGAVRVHGSVALHDLVVLALGFSGGRGLERASEGRNKRWRKRRLASCLELADLGLWWWWWWSWWGRS